jgi:hypothetical protein
LLKNTTATGVPSIAAAGTDYVAPGGALGTPASGVITNLTGTCAACTANAVPAANLTGTTLASSVVTSSLTAVGTIATGTWQGTILSPTYGGTGSNNSSSTGISQWSSGTMSVSNTLAQNLTLSGANTLSGLNTFSNSPTGSAPGTLFSGTPSTSSLYYPVVAIDAAGATAPSRNSNGTMLEANAPSGFSSNGILLWMGTSGTAALTLTGSGNLSVTGQVLASATNILGLNGIANFSANGTGNLVLGTGSTKGTGGSLGMSTLTLVAAAPTVAASQVGFGGTTAAAANCGTLSETACLVINVAGTTRYVPYF